MEQWKNIPGLDNCYFVSNIGNVMSKERLEISTRRTTIRKTRFLHKIIDRNGYYTTRLMYNGKQRIFLIHRLVMLAFVGVDKNRPFVNHKNGIKNDNRLENLEWVTRSENAKHAFRLGLQSNKGEKHPSHKLSSSQVEEIRSKYIPRKYSARKLAAEYGISKTNILDIIHKRIW
jgi:hypothetical protein